MPSENDDKAVNRLVITPEVEVQAHSDEPPNQDIEKPAKVIRIGSMIKQLLDEVRQAPLDEASRSRMREIYESSVNEIAEGLSPDLREELNRLALPFSGESVPSESELRIAQAQLVGWLEGLFHGIQATLMAQEMDARRQLQSMGRRSLPPGSSDTGEGGGSHSGAYI